MKAASDPGCRGFSLLELLLALAIASLLAALATGSYSAVTARVHRQEVRLALWRLAAAHENHHLRHGRYAASIDSRGQVDTLPEVLPAPPLPGWHFSLESIPAATWVLRASATDPRRDPDCVVWQLDATGNTTAQDDQGRDRSTHCWRR